MVEPFLTQQLFEYLEKKGATEIEIFAEQRVETTLKLSDRVHHCYKSIEQGVAIHYKMGEEEFVFRSPLWDQGNLLKALDNQTPLQNTQAKDTAHPSTSACSAQSLLSLVHNIHSAFAVGQGRYSQTRFEFKELHSHYFVTSPLQPWTSSDRTDIQAHASWKVEVESKTKKFTWTNHSTSLARFLQVLKGPEGLATYVRESISTPQTWPAPQGNIPVYWTASCISKILLPWLRSFEGDIFLQENPVLQSFEFPTPWPLTVMEKGIQDKTDAQGQPCQSRVLFKNGRPRGLACDRKTALELGVESTGHAVRQSFRHPITTGLRSIEVGFSDVECTYFGDKSWGLWVEDLQVLEQSVKTGIICLEVRRAYLLHDGKKGERIAPVIFEMEVHDFLRIVQPLEPSTQSFSFLVQKQDQAFITEMDVAPVFTPEFPFPGSISKETYWE